MNVVLDGILHRRHNFRIIALDGNRKTVRTTKTLIGFLQSKNARGFIGKQMGKVCIQSKTRFNKNGESAQCGKQEIESQSLELVLTNEWNVPR